MGFNQEKSSFKWRAKSAGRKSRRKGASIQPSKRVTLTSLLKAAMAMLVPGQLLARGQSLSADPAAEPSSASSAASAASTPMSRAERKLAKRQAKLDAMTGGGLQREGKRADRSGNVPQPTGPFATPQVEASAVKTFKDVVYSVRPNAGNQSASRKRRGQVAEGGELQLAMNIYVPPNATQASRMPLLVRIHGGGFSSGSRFANVPEMIDYARCGFVVASMDYRITKANRSSSESRLGAILAATEDVQNAIRFLRSNAAKYGIDPDRIATIGGSAGGAISLINAVVANDDVLGKSDYPGVSAKVQGAVSTGGTLIDKSGPHGLDRLKFDKDDTPALLFHAYPRDPGTGASWDANVLPTQKLFIDSGNSLELVKTPPTMHTVSLGVGTDYWPDLYEYLRKRLRLGELASAWGQKRA